MKAPFQIDFPKRLSKCSVCLTPFKSDQPLFCELFEQEEMYTRADTCENCYQKRDASIVFRTKFRKIEAPEENLDELSRFYKLLEEFLQKDQADEAFVLAQYLVRKKILVNRSSKGLYENVETGELFAIPKVNLSTLLITSIQKRILDRLHESAHP